MLQRTVKVVTSEHQGSENRLDLPRPSRMKFLALLPDRRREGILQGLQQFFQEAAAVFEQGLAQAQLQGFQIANAGALPLLASKL